MMSVLLVVAIYIGISFLKHQEVALASTITARVAAVVELGILILCMIVESESGQMPKILIYDLETAGVNALKADLSSVVVFGYKWAGEKQTHTLTIDQFPGWFGPKGLNDRPLLKAALRIMEEADIIVAHFGDYFDRPYFQGRCVLQGLTPPPPTKQRDTWQIARKAFNFSSNRLANLADILKVSAKKFQKKVPEHWPQWWLAALAGNRGAIREMAKYCRQDVEALEQVYLRLQQYDTAHPRLVDDRSKCPVCNGDVQYRGVAFVGQHKYRRFQCAKCGRWGRSTRREK